MSCSVGGAHLDSFPTPLSVLGVVGQPPHVHVALDDLRAEDVVAVAQPGRGCFPSAVKPERLRSQFGGWRRKRNTNRTSLSEGNFSHRLAISKKSEHTECFSFLQENKTSQSTKNIQLLLVSPKKGLKVKPIGPLQRSRRSVGFSLSSFLLTLPHSPFIFISQHNTAWQRDSIHDTAQRNLFSPRSGQEHRHSNVSETR